MEKVLHGARLFVGGVFLATGVMKIPELQDISTFIARVAAMPSGLAYPSAVALVILEVAAGSGLLIGWKIRLWSSSAALLLLIFLAAPLVFSASWAGRPCPCFGLSFSDMPQVLHLLLNLILLNACVIMFVTGYGGHRNADAVRSLSALQRIVIIAVCVASMAYGFLYLSAGPRETGIRLPRDRGGRIMEFLESKSIGDRGSAQKGRVAVFIDVKGFGCPMCVEDLQAMCDSLNGIVARYPEAEVVAVLRGGLGLSGERIELMAEAWARGNHIQFPVVGDTEGISDSAGFTGNSIMLLDQHNNILLLEEFPLGAEKRRGILRMFVQMQGGEG
jgi:uncharacterized membrane protein YphA (DoxX/SURF4 family)